MRGGIENEVFGATLGTSAIIVRRHRKSSDRAVQFESDILGSIAGLCDGVATPALLRTVSGQPYLRDRGHLFTAYSHIPGSHPVRSSPTLIKDLSRFATALQAVPLRNQWLDTLEPSGLPLPSLTQQLLIENIGAFSQRQVYLMEREIADLRHIDAILARFPKTIVHGDLHGGNVLVDRFGRLSGIIDFDDARIDHSALEYAGLARGHAFDDDGSFQYGQCQTIYLEAGVEFGKLCSFSEFIRLIKMACFRNMLHIYHGNKTEHNRQLREQRQINQCLDLQRWLNIGAHECSK
jgi:Ser/Thr protein kinase RdoA (MazF antagonist)